jgi:dTDP-4-dehydrorhamnose 3,5-epimerase-like enzyme
MSEAARGSIPPISPTEIRIQDVVVLARPVHQDPRGLLVETLRADDVSVDGERFRMTYTSVTVPGEFRDKDRWHLHARQTDRFVVPLGEMILALHDGRTGTPTADRLEVIRMAGPPVDDAGAPTKRDVPTYMVTIPPGVHHCIGNISDGPFVLQNFPTQYFDATDEGRVPFDTLPIGSIGRGFSWDLVRRTPPGARSAP